LINVRLFAEFAERDDTRIIADGKLAWRNRATNRSLDTHRGDGKI
jgi:hypothetical protein